MGELSVKVKRKVHLDDAKAFGIFLMVLAHKTIPENLHLAIYSFHMPLFFIVSGMFFNPQRSVTESVKKSFKSLLIPYFCFQILNLSICWIHPYLHPELYYGMQGYKMLTSAIIGIFLFVDQVTPYSYLPLGPLWFLVAMFWTRVMCSMVFNFVKSQTLAVIVTVGLSILLSLYIPSNAFSIKSACVAMPFFIVGFLISKVDLGRIDRYNAVTVLGLVAMCLSPLNGNINIDAALMGNSRIAAYLVGTLITVSVFRLFERYSVYIPMIVHDIGKATLIILCVHSFPDTALKILSKLFLPDVLMSSFSYSLIMAVMVLYLSYLIAICVKRYAPFLIGR